MGDAPQDDVAISVGRVTPVDDLWGTAGSRWSGCGEGSARGRSAVDSPGGCIGHRMAEDAPMGMDRRSNPPLDGRSPHGVDQTANEWPLDAPGRMDGARTERRKSDLSGMPAKGRRASTFGPRWAYGLQSHDRELRFQASPRRSHHPRNNARGNPSSPGVGQGGSRSSDRPSGSRAAQEAGSGAPA